MVLSVYTLPIMPYIKTLPSGPYETNAYLIGSDESDEAVLIDAPPACRAGVLETLKNDGRRLAALLITHPHFDHTMDAASFSADGVPVYAHPEAVEGIQNPETFGLYTDSVRRISPMQRNHPPGDG